MVSVRNPTFIALTAILLALLIFVVLDPLPATADVSDVGVEVQADDVSGESGEPGEMLSYDLRIKNTGTINDTYEIFVQHGDMNWSARQWVTVDGLTGYLTEIIEPGEWQYLDIRIEIPEFSPENNKAMKGLYDFRILAQSTTNRTIIDDEVFEIEIEDHYDLRIWSDVPGKNGTINRLQGTEITYWILVKNFGNTDDEILIDIPRDQLCGEMKDWDVRFGSDYSETITLGPREEHRTAVTLFIDKDTDSGEYTLNVLAESQGETSIYQYDTIYINLTEAIYGVTLEKLATSHRRCHPLDESEVEFKFTLTNTGNHDDTYTVRIETPLGFGVYKDWLMEFENKDDERVDELSVPTDLKGNTDLFFCNHSRTDITLYVTVATNEDEGEYEDIIVSATSDSDPSVVEYLYFNLSVILPNIRLSDDPQDFYIEPDSGIEEDNSIDINLRVYNDGDAETGEFYVVFYNGKSGSSNNKAGDFIAYEKVENIPARLYVDILVIWDEIQGGENDIFAYADKPIDSGILKTIVDNKFSSDGLVSESRENDNTASIDSRYREEIELLPDLTIIDIDFDDNERGRTTIVTVTVANIGSAPAFQFSAIVSLKIGGTSIKARTSKQINPGLPEEIDGNDDIDIEFVWEIPDERRNFSVRAVVDHPNDGNPDNDRMISYINSVGSSSYSSSDTEIAKDIFTNISILILIIGLLIGVFVAGSATSMRGSSRNRRRRTMSRNPGPKRPQHHQETPYLQRSPNMRRTPNRLSSPNTQNDSHAPQLATFPKRTAHSGNDQKKNRSSIPHEKASDLILPNRANNLKDEERGDQKHP